MIKKIKRYFNYVKRFAKSNNRQKLVSDIKVSMVKHGLKSGVQDFLHKKHLQDLDYKHKKVIESIGPTVIILTARHCFFVANLIKFNLERLNKTVEIIFDKPKSGYLKCIYYVICPQFFSELPKFYIAFQMEQSISSRWFTKNYLKKLKSSFIVLDYSLINIEYLLKNGLNLQQIYYLPIAFIVNYIKYLRLPDVVEKYDVLFYGDASIGRRKNFIDRINKKYKVKILSRVYGTELYNELLKAKLIINVHYYEDAILETTRIYECLSLNKLIVSEIAVDHEFHKKLNSVVDFVPINDVDTMEKRIDYWLNNDDLRQQKLVSNKAQLEGLSNEFNYYFYRFMLANDLIDYSTFYSLVGNDIDISGNFWCLSLPESQKRQRDFIEDNKYGISIFNGVKHRIGWVGCALSFKTMINKAKDLGLDYLIVCEDDVEFYPSFSNRLNIILEYLNANKKNWDIFSGLIADLNSDVVVMALDQYHGEEFVHIDKMVSTVCNIYNTSIFETILNWNEHNRNSETNTIDRYLETQENINIVTLSPFLVGHKEEHDSTLWNIKNTQYSERIANSVSLLNQKIKQYRRSR